MDNKKHICKYCGKEFETGQQLGGHVILCKNNPNRDKTRNSIKKGLSKYAPTPHKLFCECCGKEYKLICTDNDIKKGRYKKTCSTSCAHKLTTDKTNRDKINQCISERLKRYYEINPIQKKIYNCKYCGKEYTLADRHSTHYCSIECMEKGRKINLSKAAKARGFGGYNEEFAHLYNRSKRGWYKGLFCSSSWELAFVIYCLDHNIEIKRCEQILTYTDGNKILNYYPDFQIGDQIYEIKGYRDRRAILKEQQYPNIIIIDKYSIQKYLKYVIEHYGVHYIDLMTHKDGSSIINNCDISVNG